MVQTLQNTAQVSRVQAEVLDCRKCLSWWKEGHPAIKHCYKYTNGSLTQSKIYSVCSLPVTCRGAHWCGRCSCTCTLIKTRWWWWWQNLQHTTVHVTRQWIEMGRVSHKMKPKLSDFQGSSSLLFTSAEFLKCKSYNWVNFMDLFIANYILVCLNLFLILIQTSLIWTFNFWFGIGMKENPLKAKTCFTKLLPKSSCCLWDLWIVLTITSLN